MLATRLEAESNFEVDASHVFFGLVLVQRALAEVAPEAKLKVGIVVEPVLSEKHERCNHAAPYGRSATLQFLIVMIASSINGSAWVLVASGTYRTGSHKYLVVQSAEGFAIVI